MDFERISCMKCKHYQVTFDTANPRGCKLYGFKSAVMPYVLVKQSSGHDCTSFEDKTKKADSDNNGKKDYNDQKYWG
jgi:hypothetical protein